MKYAHLLWVIGSSLLVVACAQGDDGNNKNVGSGGSGGMIVGGGGSGGMINTGGANTGGTNTGTGGGSVSADCAASGYTDASCGSCMEANCANQCEACMNNADCVSWLQCAVNCQDATCEDACTQQYPAGESPALAWLGNSGCIGTACGTQCGTTSSGGCGLSTNGAYPECDTCIESYCCTQGNACGNDPGCTDVLTCIQGCATGDTACENNCMNANPTGAQELNDFFGCLSQMCATQCGG